MGEVGEPTESRGGVVRRRPYDVTSTWGPRGRPFRLGQCSLTGSSSSTWTNRHHKVDGDVRTDRVPYPDSGLGGPGPGRRTPAPLHPGSRPRVPIFGERGRVIVCRPESFYWLDLTLTRHPSTREGLRPLHSREDVPCLSRVDKGD